MKFLEYELHADVLCMGERTKAGILKPCDRRTIRYSQITGALRRRFGISNIHAAGYLIEKEGVNQIDYLIYSPRDRFIGISKIPLQVEFIRNVLGLVYIRKNEATEDLPEVFEIFMGALLSKGFGQCKLVRKGTIETERSQKGLLRTRIPLKYAEVFDIKNILKPIYGYLFEPSSITSGEYILSLFEDSVVIGPKFLLSEEKRR